MAFIYAFFFTLIYVQRTFRCNICSAHLILPNVAVCYLKDRFFTDPYFAGVSNKHCLLTFFPFMAVTFQLIHKLYSVLLYWSW